ncbi:hypothetical protein, partial [Pseudomonas viridiflava]|uniref:hypothetical protein n=1 Tax=Pseudomonas viridiflava TaxID=33069 RepID=UPI00197F7905
VEYVSIFDKSIENDGNKSAECELTDDSLLSAMGLHVPHRQSLPRQPCQTVIHASGWLLSSIYTWRCGGVIHQ